MALLLAAAALVAAGCGDDEDEESADQAPAPAQTQPETQADTAGGGEATAVSLTDFAIDPANPTTKAGRVTFSVTNDGQAPHALEVEGNGIEEETEVLNGGEADELAVELQPGEYKWYCPVGDHAAQGMAGTLTVE